MNENELIQQDARDERIEDLIEHEEVHQFEGSGYTVCALRLTNGFSILGSGLTHDYYGEAVAKDIARWDARDQVRRLYPYIAEWEAEKKQTSGKDGPEFKFAPGEELTKLPWYKRLMTVRRSMRNHSGKRESK